MKRLAISLLLLFAASANAVDFTPIGGGFSSSQIDTSAELAAIVGDETGSGALVLGTSPTFTTSLLVGSDIVLSTASATIFNETGGARDFRIESDANANMLFVDGTNNRVGVGLSNPSTTLEINGTIKATGFAGTVFVRDGTFQAGSNMSPVDATTYYGGQGDTVQISATIRKMYITSACTLTKFYGWFGSNAGTNEQSTIYVRVNNTTDYTVTSTLAIAAVTEYNNTSLSIALNAGDYIEVKWVTPTWATNPTSVRGGFTMEFQK